MTIPPSLSNIPFQPRKLFPYLTCRILLYLTYYITHRIFWRDYHQYVYMVNLYILLDYFTPRHFLHYFREKFAYIPPHSRIQDTAAIFGYPYDMVLGSDRLHAQITAFHIC